MYRLIIERRVSKEVSKLPKNAQQRIDDAIQQLRINPFAGKKLEGEYEGAWTIRAWPYRIIYSIDRKLLTVTVLRVGHRQGVYK